MYKRIKFLSMMTIWIVVCIAANSMIPSYIVHAQEDSGLQLFAGNAILIDGENGDVLYEKNASDHRPNASTTKILTCILALECGNMEDEVSVSAYAAKMPEVRLGAREGEQYRLEDMLYALMLESYNDAAVVIAEHIAGSVQTFADMMNAKAEELGCHDSYFITPNGLDAQDDTGVHGTSAADLARIMRYCIMVSPQKEEFLEITQTKAYAFSDSSGQRSFSCMNHNALLDMMDEVVSGKTGFTCDAGYCYVGAASRNGHTYIWALLGCGWPNNKTYKWKDSRQLVMYAEENAAYTELSAPDPPDVQVEYSSKSMTPGTVDTICSVSMTYASVGQELRYEYKVADEVHAPVYKGMVVGYMLIYSGDTLIDIENVSLAQSMDDVSIYNDIMKVMKRVLM